MHALILATLLSAPIYPLNPVEEDTISQMNAHFTVGISGPSGILSSGPEFSGKYEVVIGHPFIIRSAVDYRINSVNSRLYPDGNLNSIGFSFDWLYYRGTSDLTGYLGLGLVYAVYDFSLSAFAADSLRLNEGITSVKLRSSMGYRFTFGLRYHRIYSIEIGLSSLNPAFVFRRQLSPSRFSKFSKNVTLNDFRISFGYLLSIKAN